MRNKFPFIAFAVFSVVFFSGCQSVPSKNVATILASKCAPMHNLSQEKRKACTGLPALNTQSQGDGVANSVGSDEQKKS